MEDPSSSVVSEVCDSVPSRLLSGTGLKFLFRVVGSADCDHRIHVVCVSVAMGVVTPISPSSLDSGIKTSFFSSSAISLGFGTSAVTSPGVVSSFENCWGTLEGGGTSSLAPFVVGDGSCANGDNSAVETITVSASSLLRLVEMDPGPGISVEGCLR
jgi:hypothetical protein